MKSKTKKRGSKKAGTKSQLKIDIVKAIEVNLDELAEVISQKVLDQLKAEDRITVSVDTTGVSVFADEECLENFPWEQKYGWGHLLEQGLLNEIENGCAVESPERFSKLSEKMKELAKLIDEELKQPIRRK